MDWDIQGLITLICVSLPNPIGGEEPWGVGSLFHSRMGKLESQGRSQSLELLNRELKITASDPAPVPGLVTFPLKAKLPDVDYRPGSKGI